MGSIEIFLFTIVNFLFAYTRNQLLIDDAILQLFLYLEDIILGTNLKLFAPITTVIT